MLLYVRVITQNSSSTSIYLMRAYVRLFFLVVLLPVVKRIIQGGDKALEIRLFTAGFGTAVQ